MGQTTDDMNAGELGETTGQVDLGTAAPSGTTAPGALPSGTVGGGGIGDTALGYGSNSTGDATAEGDEVEQTRAQIEQTRAQMSGTIDAIQEKLSPSNLAQQAKDTVHDATIGKAQDMVSNAGDTAKGFSSSIVETIRQNPIPAALAGFGLGWLFMSGRKSSSRSDWDNYGYRSYDYRGNYGYSSDYGSGSGQGVAGRAQGAVSSVAGQAQDKVGDIASQAQGAAGNVTGQVQDTAGQVAEGAQNLANQAGQTVSDLADTAQYGAQQAQSGFQQLLQENPLAVAAGSLALGLAVGLAIPETEKEKELMGQARDNLMQQAQETFQDKAQQVQAVAQQAASAAKDAAQSEASSQGLTQQ